MLLNLALCLCLRTVHPYDWTILIVHGSSGGVSIMLLPIPNQDTHLNS